MYRIEDLRVQDLPAAGICGELNRLLEEHQGVVVTAPPGAGKSTLLPLAILLSLSKRDNLSKIIMLEPRRLAARQVAERMAQMIGEPVGKTVGYRIRFETRISSETRIEVVTEGILTRMLVSDSLLEGVSAVIFDEFHERSIHADVALAMALHAQRLVRSELKLVIMSATIDSEDICSRLGFPALHCEGNMFPVQIDNSRVTPDPRDCAREVAHCIRESLRSGEGDILAFLPGEADILRCQELLDGCPAEVYPLYGILSSQEQRAAIAPSAAGRRKVVLATSIAETSLTIEGIRTVIDSGLCRKQVFNPRNGLSRLETVTVSKDMAVQRAGRAGRVAPGHCHRLWGLGTESRMAECRVPEITEADLCSTVLDIAAWGEAQIEELPWLTPPPFYGIVSARDTLTALGALDSDGRISSRGRQLAAFPCHPRIANILLHARTESDKALAADIAAIIEEKDPLGQEAYGADIRLRIGELRKARAGNGNRSRWSRIMSVAAQYRALVKALEDNSEPDYMAAGTLIAAAYPERVALASKEDAGRYMLSGGSAASLDFNDNLCAFEWLSVASLSYGKESPGRIFLAAPLNPESVPDLTSVRDHIAWSSKEGKVICRRETRIGGLIVKSVPIHGESQNQIVAAICEAVAKDGASMLDFSEEVTSLQRRVATVAAWHPELELPDISSDAVLADAVEWLPLYIGKATSVAELKRIPLARVLWNMLDYRQQQEVERLAPTHIEVPSGSRIRVEYRIGAETPVLRVRLQECFGLTQTPKVDDDKRAVLMELLSPGYKPVQLTRDLHSFWKNTYFEVRKELKRRYPKHSWPDNPLMAEAVRGIKRK